LVPRGGGTILPCLAFFDLIDTQTQIFIMAHAGHTFVGHAFSIADLDKQG